MKILHESPDCYIQQCSECGTVMQYSMNDILIKNKIYIHPMDGNKTFCASYDQIICPHCCAILPATKEWFYNHFLLKNP